jgi:hypothetical protein
LSGKKGSTGIEFGTEGYKAIMSQLADATAGYILCYPMAMFLAFQNKPVPAAIITPLIMAGVPWLLAEVHLDKVLKDPEASKPGEFIGLPGSYWPFGLGGAFVLELKKAHAWRRRVVSLGPSLCPPRRYKVTSTLGAPRRRADIRLDECQSTRAEDELIGGCIGAGAVARRRGRTPRSLTSS